MSRAVRLSVPSICRRGVHRYDLFLPYSNCLLYRVIQKEGQCLRR